MKYAKISNIIEIDTKLKKRKEFAMYTCAKCGQTGCASRNMEKTLPECPSKNEAVQKKALEKYEQEENQRIAYHSACTEAEGYGKDTRLIEIIHFMKRAGYQKIGFAFCKGLLSEAREVSKILEYHGFEVVSVICKNGGIPKAVIGVEDEYTLSGSAEEEVMCNPIGQAEILNEAGTEFNVVMGLCVGHDTLFFKYIQSPVTVLAVKDRVTGHNPLAPIYCAQGYYKNKFYPEKEGER